MSWTCVKIVVLYVSLTYLSDFYIVFKTLNIGRNILKTLLLKIETDFINVKPNVSFTFIKSLNCDLLG